MSKIPYGKYVKFAVAIGLSVVAFGNFKGIFPTPPQRLEEVRASLELLPPTSESRPADGLKPETTEELVEGMRSDIWKGFWRSILLLISGLCAAITFFYPTTRRTILICAIGSMLYLLVWSASAFGLDFASMFTTIHSRADLTLRLIGLRWSGKSFIVIHDNVSVFFYLTSAVWALSQLYLRRSQDDLR